MSQLKTVLACALLVALTLLTISARVIRSATVVINALPDRVSAEAQVTRAALVGIMYVSTPT